jgi:hypothetical protein
VDPDGGGPIIDASAAASGGTCDSGTEQTLIASLAIFVLLVVIVSAIAITLYLRLQRATAHKRAASAATYISPQHVVINRASDSVSFGPVERDNLDYLRVVGDDDDDPETTVARPPVRGQWTAIDSSGGTPGNHFYPAPPRRYLDQPAGPVSGDPAHASRPLSFVTARPDSLLESDEETAAKLHTAQRHRLAQSNMQAVHFGLPMRSSASARSQPRTTAETGF